jgi:hypothetical protein
MSKSLLHSNNLLIGESLILKSEEGSGKTATVFGFKPKQV